MFSLAIAPPTSYHALAKMGSNQQPTPHDQLSISKEEKRKRDMENNEAYIIEPGHRERARLRGGGQTLVPVQQRGPWPHQYKTSSNRQSPAFNQQQAGIPGQFRRTGQYAEAPMGNQEHPRQDSGRIRALEAQVATLSQQLQDEEREKNYYKYKTSQFYLRLCLHEPGMSAQQRRTAEKLLVTHLTPPTLTAIPSVTIPSDSGPSALLPSVLSSFVPAPSAATLSVHHPSIPHSSIPHPSTTRVAASRPSAHPPPAPTSSAPRPFAPPPSAPPPTTHRSSAPRPSAPRQGTFLSSNPSRHTPRSASPVTASALHIDLTIDDSPPSPRTSQKRKWASEEERQAGDHLRKNILTKKFEWMEPKDRPNFKNRNPYKPLDLDPTEHEQYHTQALHYDHDLGQANQEPPLAPSQAPAHLPAWAKLPNPKISQPSGPRARRLDKDELGGNARAQSMSEAQERMKAKKKQITREHNAAMAEKTLEQEVGENETATGMEAPLEQEESEDNETMAAEMEAWLEQEEPEDNEMVAAEVEAMLWQEDPEDDGELW